MFGLLKLHGPILTVEDENGNVAATENPYSWHRKHNMIYIDNPVGAGKWGGGRWGDKEFTYCS
jgi:carboxypeptidase C (cathepsin A)